MPQPNDKMLALCHTLAYIQALVAEDRVTGEDDDCIAACGTVMNYLANEWGLDKDWLENPLHQHDLVGAPPELVQEFQVREQATKARAHQTVTMLLATGEAPTVMRSAATASFVDSLRQDGVDIQIPGEE